MRVARLIGGLIVSTALSLLVVPAFYVVADRGKHRISELVARRRRRRAGRSVI